MVALYEFIPPRKCLSLVMLVKSIEDFLELYEDLYGPYGNDLNDLNNEHLQRLGPCLVVFADFLVHVNASCENLNFTYKFCSRNMVCFSDSKNTCSLALSVYGTSTVVGIGLSNGLINRFTDDLNYIISTSPLNLAF